MRAVAAIVGSGNIGTGLRNLDIMTAAAARVGEAIAAQLEEGGG